MQYGASCRFSNSKDTYSVLQASTSFPLIYPFSCNSSNSWLKSYRGAWLSPLYSIAGQKQLIPWPVTDVGATVIICNWQILQGGKGHHSGTQILGIGSQLCQDLLSQAFRWARKFSSFLTTNFELIWLTCFFHCSTSGNESLYLFLQKAVDETRQLSEGVIPVIRGSWDWTKVLLTKTATYITNIEPRSLSP